MDRGVAVVLTAFVGGLIALQAPINSMLGKATGSFQAAFISFAIGTVVLAVIAAFAKGGFGTMGEAKTLSWYYLTGGVLGAAYVTTVLVTVRELGAGPVVAATIAGQLSASVVLDQFGMLGLPKDPITLGKVIGVVLLSLGVYLIVRD
ncbi:MAG: DMT family transporter [Actinomycetota bacterium]|nr:DMT family transporter [Actinomycetota bacterium]MDQ5808255.1 DMT family transporter [Actinomycetota bacterium]